MSSLLDWSEIKSEQEANSYATPIGKSKNKNKKVEVQH